MKNIDKLTIKQRILLNLNKKIRDNEKIIHPLRQLFWECTLRCNIHCRHCGSDCKGLSVVPDMPKEDFLAVLDKSITPHVNPHKVMIIFSGGEPLMRKDLELCGREVYMRGYPWGLVTNGFFLDEKRFKSLLASGLHSITVSLDGFEADHNWLRGHDQSFERAVNAVKLIAKEPRLAWDVVTCVNKRTLPYLEKFKEFLISIGVKDWRIFSIVPMGRAESEPDLQLDDNEFRQMFDFIVQTRQKGDINLSYSCEGYLGALEGVVRNHYFHCSAGVSVASILIDGSISACTSIRGKYYQGNIYHDDFWDVWENRFEQYRNREWMRQIEPCKSCKAFKFCEGNGMHLRREDGSLMFCHLQRLREK